ncbi:hypothetical protein ACOME3_008687 [Neoechinorhynchus agilis]
MPTASSPPINHAAAPATTTSALSGLRQVMLCHKWVGAGGGKRRSASMKQQQQQQHYQQKGRTSVQLMRRDAESLIGLTLSGSRDGKTRILHLKPNSIAERCDCLEVNDVIVSINGKSELSHDEIGEMIKYTQINVPLTVEVEYDYPICTLNGQETVKTLEVYLSREQNDAGFGFVARNAIFFQNDAKSSNSTATATTSRRVYVTSVRPNGPADMEGSIKTGDRVIAANGISVMDADELYTIMLGAISVRLLIEYDVESISCSATGAALLVEIEKAANVAIGICVVQRWINSRSVVVIDYVKPASIADRCGAIRVGDILLSIGNQLLEGNNSIKEARRLLRIATLSENVKLEVASLPINANLARRSALSDQRHFPTQAPQSQVLHAYCNSAIKTVRDSAGVHLGSHLMVPHSGSKTHSLIRSASPYAVTPQSLILNTQICHTETANICLQVDNTGNFGFTLQGSCPLTGALTSAPIVGYVDPDGPAASCCSIQAGDRVTAVNGQRLGGLSLDNARSIIKESGSRMNLEIEFDVAESVSLSSGVFQVKLIKKASDLGLNMIYPKNAQADEAPMIADVRKGSIAHRSGMINLGDRLLAIDQHSVLGMPVSEIHNILTSIGCGEIVRLKLRKDEYFADDNLNDQGVTYTVEIQRQGGPLGITISAPDEPFDPVVVSGLSSGGLVDRTNAIHIGDRILAINGISLRGKGLNEALKLLQGGQDPVTLKIFRPLTNQLSMAKLKMIGDQQDNANSLDSALESWMGSHVSDQRLSDQSPEVDPSPLPNRGSHHKACVSVVGVDDKVNNPPAPFPTIDEDETEKDYESDGKYDNCL